MRRAPGFTLIEVLIALAVFAIAMTALVQAGVRRTENLGYLRDRTLANWIAENRLSALRLEPDRFETGSRDGEIEMAGRQWHWRARIKETRNDTIRRVRIAVRRGADPDAIDTDSTDDAALAHLTGYLARPSLRAKTTANADSGP